MRDYAYKFLYASVILLAVFASTSLAADSFAIAVGVIGLILLIASKKFRFQKSDLAPGLFSISYFWSSFFSINPIHSLLDFHYIWHFAPYWITSRAKVNAQKIINILAIFIMVSAFGLYFNAFFHLKPVDIFTTNIRLLHFSMPTKGYIPQGFSGYASYIGAIMLISTFFFGSLGVYLKRKLYLAASFFALIATILAQERQDWLGLIVGVLFIPLFVKNKKIWLIYLIGAVCALALAQTNFVKHSLYYTLHYTKDPAIVIRFAMIKASIDTFEHSSFTRKFTGYGPDYASKIVHDNTVKFYKQMAQKYHINPNVGISTVIDNYYINVLMTSGVVGLLLILAGFFLLLRNYIKAMPNAPPQKKAILVGMSLGLISFYVASGFDNLLGSAQVSIFVSFMIGLVEIA